MIDLPPSVRLESGKNGLPMLRMSTADGSSVSVYLHGAHVTDYRIPGKPPVLFMSEESHFEKGKPIRGGVPICFPWFGPRVGHPESPAHGFARLSEWELVETSPGELSHLKVSVTLKLRDTEATRAAWPHAFEALYTVALSPTPTHSLNLSLEVRNTGGDAFSFEEALHSYFNVGDVKQAQVIGLDGLRYFDKVKQGEAISGKERIRFTGETDRVYFDAFGLCTVIDPSLHREIIVRSQNSKATVVWNPWIAKAKAMADFGDDEWPSMVCIEAGNVMDKAITLEPGASHTIQQTIMI